MFFVVREIMNFSVLVGEREIRCIYAYKVLRHFGTIIAYFRLFYRRGFIERIRQYEVVVTLESEK